LAQVSTPVTVLAFNTLTSRVPRVMFSRIACVWLLASPQVVGAARQKKNSGLTQTGTFAGVPLLDAPLDEDHDLRDFMLFFDKGATNAQLVAFCENFEDCFAGHPDQGGLPFVSVRGSDEQQLKKIFSKPGVLTASSISADPVVEDDPMEEVFESGVQSDAVWGVERVRARESRFTGRGVHAYILDSGVRTTHEDFGGRAIPTTDFAGGRLRVCDPTDRNCARDGRGHGTHCAGSAGASTYGVAPECLVRAMDRGRTLSDAYSSMDWLTQNAEFPAVVSMSFGVQGVQQSGAAAVRRLADAGITSVVASGNSNRDTCGFTLGFVPEAISVAASTSTDSRASFSNFGSCIDIFAPGSSILSTDFRADIATSTKSGTSMAAPHVTGVVALMLEEKPALTPAEVKSELRRIAFKNVLSNIKGDDPNLLLRAPQ